ncbi:ABC transporter substrate-binding protein [Anaerosporobacter sp.]|uniref:ABC transporter substrate-binding protein n=1 Tax=Anaerosporobacter sp. TaxID=1872529 RepID=UPI00286ECDBA|nr:ABC transporter substrate-binding protein [Anaerosporobacter sp.]
MKKKFFSKYLLMLTVLMFAIALSGCKGDKSNKNTNKTLTTDDTSSKEPTYGGSVVVGITQDLDSLDPHKAVAAGTKEVLFNVYEGLVKPDENGDLVPAVASEYHISEDGKTYTFTLRDGVKFHNGNAVTAEDVKYSIERCAGLLEETDPSVKVESALSNIMEVKILDDKTIQLVLNNADTELIAYLICSIVPANYADLDTAPMGTGPFKFVSYTPLVSFVMDNNQEYWGDKAYLDQVTFKISANTDAAFMELMAGSIDVFPYLTDDQATQLPDTYHIEEGSMNLVQALFLNNGKAPFDDIRVRQAICYAIERQNIIEMLSAGRGTIIDTNMFPAFTKYYNTDLADTYAHNVEKAKDLLKEAGYDNTLKFTITVPSNYQYHVDTAQVIAAQLKEIGVTVEIQLVEWNTWLEDVYTNREFESTIIGLTSNLAPRDSVERFSSTAKNNFINYNNAEFDATFQKAIASTVDEEKVAYYKQLQTYLTNDAASAYIQDPALLVAVNKKLAGYTFYPVYVQDMAKVYYIAE